MVNKLIAKLFSKISVTNQQYILLFFVMATIGMFIYIMSINIGKNPVMMKKEEVKAEPKEATKKLETVSDAIDSGEIWRYKMDDKNRSLENDITQLRDVIGNLMSSTQNPDNNQEINSLKQKIHLLEQNQLNKSNQELLGNQQFQNQGSNQVIPEEGLAIKKITIALEPRQTADLKQATIETTIPAGAFAKAIILGGVDASTSILSPGDPRPLLLRIDDPGTLPRRFISDLEDCHIVASGYGDLSSERVFTRLEKLTCVDRKSKEIVETEVAGYIAGEDGRAGLKGEVIEKTRGYIGKSIIGGVLQGVGNIMSPGQDMYNSTAGILVPKRKAGQKFQEGFGEGMQGSMERLSKYYIDRAESISPVIQIGSGRIVDVVFTEGAEIGSKRVKEQLEKKRINEINGHNFYETN